MEKEKEKVAEKEALPRRQWRDGRIFFSSVHVCTHVNERKRMRERISISLGQLWRDRINTSLNQQNSIYKLKKLIL